MVSVGVVIPCHNQGRTLERAVKSALAADRVMIINDCSLDYTDGVASALRDRYPNVEYRQTGDTGAIGVCGARNLGVVKLGTDLAIPLDADDYFLPNGLETLRDAYETGTFVYSNYVTEAGEQTASPSGMINRKNISHATICFSRLNFFEAHGYDIDFTLGCEDWALTCAFVQAGLRPKHIPVATYYRTENPNGRAARCLKYAPLLQQLLKDKYPQVFTS